ncbi:alpha-ketoglutarate-dependent dioxygenase AlkB [Arenibacter sp. GZD96]|uniref:alpha-ketoglutarate-dependent dioxygenase AlkB family protein n=1 Tax=Aurantibrevibacter litoralis TaxID=3106030 RepID=UPI002AFF4C67|nr:alpha-ketoglutarate-dependent dioxygenase AlkB [Arenibacter sp. GZD-96]MEA1787539.1 alpha-ketoglutarate-dependent dioxygenase AlkB [Arenibacter sp. GZD-96]
MNNLFTDKIKLSLPDSDITYFPGFFNPELATTYFQSLRKNVLWRLDHIKVFGKIHQQPRLTALYGTNGKTYSYANITMTPLQFSKDLTVLKQQIEDELHVAFTTCLLNLYRNGKDSNGWHADDEKELGRNPIIASVSLGQARFFHLKHKKEPTLKHKILLEHGSLLVMQGETQHHWLHQIPKTTKTIGERINLTFRIIT